MKKFSQHKKNESKKPTSLSAAIEAELKANDSQFETSFPTRELREIKNTKDKSKLNPGTKKVYDKLVRKYKLSESAINELDNPSEISGDQVQNKPTDSGNAARQSAAEQGAEGTVDKNERIKTHVFRYVGSDGDGLVFSRKRDEEKMNSENWQYLGEFSLPGALVNQLPRNEEKKEWRVVHKN